MKRLLLCLFILMELSTSAQIVNIPDANFKQALVSYSDIVGRTIDTNGDGEIQYSEAAAFSQVGGGYILSVNNKNISDLTGIQAFTSLSVLNCEGNQLTGLDISNMPISQLNCRNNNLTFLNLAGCGDFLWSVDAGNNQLSALDLSGLYILHSLILSYNNFTSLDVSNAPALKSLGCDHNQLIALDLSQNSVSGLSCAYNQLTSLNVKNGQVFDYTGNFPPFDASGNPGLQYVCADTAEVLYLLNYFIQNGMENVQVDANCSFSTSGGYGTVSGVARLDFDNNGCSIADSGKTLLPLKLTNDNDTAQNFFIKADSSGNYSVHSYAGNYSLTPRFQIPYYTFTPDTIHFTSVPGITQNFDFCITPNGIHNDLDIKINYIVAFIEDGIGRVSITYKNKGTETLSGDVQLDFEAAKMNFQSAIPAVNNLSAGFLTWNFLNLKPFTTGTIDVSFYILQPPVNNIGDTLTFTASINPVASDETPADNSFMFRGPITYSVLPISMEYFKGNSNSGKHYLNWKASCTSIQAKFTIERSTDGRNFNSLQSITASNTRCLQPFDFIDANPAAGMNYYRIKMTDIDGKASYSSIIALLNKKTGFEILNLVPNPVTGNSALLNITSAEKQVIDIKISDASGKVVQSVGQSVISGFTPVKLNFRNLASGIYTISIYTGNGERKTTQFIKQ